LQGKAVPLVVKNFLIVRMMIAYHFLIQINQAEHIQIIQIHTRLN
jgi:hypothetical protein